MIHNTFLNLYDCKPYDGQWKFILLLYIHSKLLQFMLMFSKCITTIAFHLIFKKNVMLRCENEKQCVLWPEKEVCGLLVGPPSSHQPSRLQLCTAKAHKEICNIFFFCFSSDRKGLETLTSLCSLPNLLTLFLIKTCSVLAYYWEKKNQLFKTMNNV